MSVMSSLYRLSHHCRVPSIGKTLICLHYFASAIVVFDGYRNPSTKYMTHQRCTDSKIGVEATFTEDMKLTTTKDIFLANVANKYNFILLRRRDVGVVKGTVSVDGHLLSEIDRGGGL